MESERNGGPLEEDMENLTRNGNESGLKASSSKVVALNISTSRKGLLSGYGRSIMNQDQLKVVFGRKIPRYSSGGRLSSPSANFMQIAGERDEVSHSVPSSTGEGFRCHLDGILSQKFEWASLWIMFFNWIGSPYNMVLLLWISCITVSGAILFLVMTGMLNGVIPRKSQRNTWFEVNNQILNALFTLMCLYQHPKRFHHLVLLCRWWENDIITLRKIYCKCGTYKPHEWAHMMVVVVLLHVNCFAQYALCGLNLGYKRSERPAIGVGTSLCVAIAAPAMAGVYAIVSPLGRDYNCELDEEVQNQDFTNGTRYPNRHISLERRISFASRNDYKTIEHTPVWRGSIFDIWDNIAIAYLSLFCGFCVFGWNMKRLGFGNMYVHIATFLLCCTAPFWIFNLAAVNIDSDLVREALGLAGIVLCLFGLLYGGFWRIQMRKRFNLPANNICCGKPAIADCSQWLFCCWCSLAQEVRTADFYNIVEDKFCQKQDEVNQLTLPSLPREGGLVPFKSSPSVQNSIGLSSLGIEFPPSPNPNRLSKDHYGPDRHLPSPEKEYSTNDTDYLMQPPVSSPMQRKEYSLQNT